MDVKGRRYSIDVHNIDAKRHLDVKGKTNRLETDRKGKKSSPDAPFSDPYERRYSINEESSMLGIQLGNIPDVFFYKGKQYPLRITSEVHQIIYELEASRFMFYFILIVIFLNVLLLILSTFPSIESTFGWYITALDDLCLSIFIMEVLMKLYAFRKNYFYDNWNILDMIVVVINSVQFALPSALRLLAGYFKGPAIFKWLKIMKGAVALRSLRLLRMIR